MSILKDIQSTAVDSKNDIATLLRKCKILAAKLGNDDFKQWVDNELNGYKKGDKLPDYRVLQVNLFGHFANDFGGGEMNNAHIPPLCLPESFRDSLVVARIGSPISSCVDLVHNGKEDLKMDLPPDFMPIFGAKIYKNMHCLSAWKLIPRNALVGVIDTVRNRILSFTLEIEKEAPDAGEAPINSNPIPQEKVTKVFNTNIFGNVHNVATGSEQFTQSVEFKIEAGNFKNLTDFLSMQGLEKEDIEQLENALKEDGKIDQHAGFGKKVTSWMANMFNKAASGALNVGIDKISPVIIKALSQYFGLD